MIWWSWGSGIFDMKKFLNWFYFSIDSENFKKVFWSAFCLITILAWIFFVLVFKKTTEQFGNVYAPLLDIVWFLIYEFMTQAFFEKSKTQNGHVIGTKGRGVLPEKIENEFYEKLQNTLKSYSKTQILTDYKRYELFVHNWDRFIKDKFLDKWKKIASQLLFISFFFWLIA